METVTVENVVDTFDMQEGGGLSRAKSRVLAEHIHKLRTPLMLVQEPVKKWVDEAGGPPGEAGFVLEYVAQLQRQIDQIEALLDLEMGEQELRPVTVNIVEWLAQQVQLLRPLARRSSIEIEFEAEADTLWCALDRGKMAQVWQGLIQRAMQQATAGDTIRIVVEAEASGNVVVLIEDTAPPVSEGFLRLLCEDWGWDTHEEALSEAVGLELALARSFIILHGGEVEATSRLDLGTQVQLRLPMEEQTYVSERRAPAGAEMARSVGETTAGNPAGQPGDSEAEGETTILVVDDHAGMRSYMRLALRKHYRVLEAAGGEEALVIVKEQMPDLVVSDIMMPGMDGRALCRAIKEDPGLSHIPVFLVTANVIPEVKRDGLAAGADDYLTKPFDIEEAVLRINNMIRMRGQLRQRFSREVVIKPSDITVSSEDEAFLEKARMLVEQHMEDANFGVQELASELGISPRQLQRRLRETVGQAPVEFIRSLRLQRAGQLLECRYGNVSEVAYAVGFTSLSYFAKCFRNQFGRSPSAFKAEHQPG